MKSYSIILYVIISADIKSSAVSNFGKILIQSKIDKFKSRILMLYL